jgi:hypothetical protein
MTLQIIGAGFGRTGTLSLKVALETLGFAPCYHMSTVIAQPERIADWTRLADRQAQGQPIDWEAVLNGFQATVDWPGCAYWRELMAAYPTAKVLLSVRDPQRWYDSAAKTIFHMTGPEAETMWQTAHASLPPEVIDRMRQIGAFVDELVWQGTFGGGFADRGHAIRIFEERNAAVMATAPSERLLVYEVKEGWEPLCRFLGVPVPVDTPFPHVNDSASFQTARTDPVAFRQRLLELAGI